MKYSIHIVSLHNISKKKLILKINDCTNHFKLRFVLLANTNMQYDFSLSDRCKYF